MLVPSLVVFAVVTLCLFLPRASEYFSAPRGAA
jgi:hypothetical protein